MKMFGKLVDDKLEYAPKDLVMASGMVIFDYYSDIERLIIDGYKEVIDVRPTYDETTQYVELKGYAEGVATIEILYEVKTIEFDTKKEEQFSKCIAMIAQGLSDEQSLLVPLVFPEYEHPHHYEVGDKFRYEGVLYKVLQEHDTQVDWNPSNAPSLYTKVLSQQPGEDIPKWEQPGAENAYMKGDKVTLDGKIYESLIDNNVWKPTEYPAGWREVNK